MAFNITKRTAESSGSLETRTLKHSGSAKVSHAIFTGMVKDKISYPIRELCKNAWEVSPKTKPFLVVLPTTWDQIFKVRDFGPGLSHAFMMTKYPKIGYSTKDKGGTEVNGVSGWGFGSKSALAYLMEDGLTGTFSVVSRHREKNPNGEAVVMERHYTIMIGKKGDIEVHLKMEFETEEDTGLEVSFAVRAADIDDFQERAADILWSFHPRPIITPEPNWEEPKILQKGKGWTQFDSRTVPWVGPHVRVGPVMYPIDLQEIKHSGFVRVGDDIIFDLDKREVTATASREALQYTSGSKQAIADMLHAYEEDYAKVVRTRVQKAKTYFEACAVFEEETQGLDRERRAIVRHMVRWEERELVPVVPYKTMLLDEHWSLFDKFKHNPVDTVKVGRAEVAVEFTPYRTIDRMEAAGLKGKKTLLIRLKRKDFDEFLVRFGLRKDHVTVLDDFKIAGPGSARVGHAHNRLRMRKVYELKVVRVPQDPITKPDGTVVQPEDRIHVAYEEKKAVVDLSAGGFKMQRAGYSGRRYRTKIYRVSEAYDYNDTTVQFNSFRDYALKDVVEEMTKRGLLKQDTFTVYIDDQDDVLEGDWQWFGDYLDGVIKDGYDAAQLTPRKPPTHNTLTTTLMRVMKYAWDNAPADLKDLLDRVKSHRDAQSSGHTATVTLNEHDKRFELLQRLHPHLQPPLLQLKDPIQVFNEEFEALEKKYVLLHDLAAQNHWHTSHGQAAFDHYYDLIGRAGLADEPTPVPVDDEDLDAAA